MDIALRLASHNLLENAAAHEAPTTARIERDEGKVQIVIEDHGPGILEDDLAWIFEPFLRTQALRSRDTEDSEFGLATAGSFVQGQDGDIALAGRLEGGLCPTAALSGAG
ncbi:MAG: hypothetical protein F4Y03_05540 [Alphaproteobacteria bacterium]|nr:hypothetical protein [Alphaproteobacteria bacterium]